MGGPGEFEAAGGGAPRPCWCGNGALAPYGDGYLRCTRCGTLVSQVVPARDAEHVEDEASDLYGLNYFVDHARALGHPDLVERSRLDLSERCVFWLEALLRRRPPPARTLELGCGNGAFVALLATAGYDSAGLDLSPAVTAHARDTFGIEVLTGPLEEQDLAAGSLDAVLMMDVLEHLPDPLRTLRSAAELLKADGLLLVQTPHLDPGRTLDDLHRAGAPFLEQLKAEEHLFLLSRDSATELLSRAGFGHVLFEPAIFSQYDMFLVASRAPIPAVPEATWREALRRSRTGRVVEALVDAYDRSRPEEQERARARAALGQLALLRRVFRIDYEQLLAFQYAKLVSAGDRVIDVGAHTGLHTARFLHLVGPGGRVVAVEPLPHLVEGFLRPLYGSLPHCRVFQGALSDHAGRDRFHVATGSEQESGLRAKRSYKQPMSGEGTTIDVELSTVDALAEGGPVAFVKIDVEGAELGVLAGARETLARARPIVAVETSRESIEDFGGTPGALFDLAEGQGYAVATLLGERLSRAGLEVYASSGVVWDFFLVPLERMERVSALLREGSSPYVADRFVDLRATDQSVHVEGMVGFSFLESWGRWTDGRIAPAASVQLVQPLPAEFGLEIVAMGIRSPESAFDVVVEDAARTLRVPPGRLSAVSASFVTSGEARVITIRPHRTVSPGKDRPGADPRRLGVGVQSLRVLPARR